MTDYLKPEPASCDLLLAIARRDAAAIRNRAKSVCDWEDFLRLADIHRMTPMAAVSLVNLNSVPASIRGRLSAEYERNVCQSFLIAAELLKVLAAFAREQITAMPFKGLMLAASAYGDLGLRACGDLDLLIQRNDLNHAMAILRTRGYQCVAFNPIETHEYTFERAADGTVLELRWVLDFIQSRYGQNLGLDWGWEGRQETQLSGTTVPCMSPEKTLIMLCMHASKHVWSRLLWVCDIARLIASSPGLDWEAAAREARSLGLWKAVALGILLAQRIADAPAHCPLQASIRQSETVLKLANHFEKNLIANPGRGPHGRIPYNLRLLDFRDQMRLLVSARFLTPNARDRAAIPFRGPEALYYLIRPVRLLLDRSAR